MHQPTRVPPSSRVYPNNTSSMLIHYHPHGKHEKNILDADRILYHVPESLVQKSF